ncbi:MAG: hypothetical protein AAF593_16270 [Planctomycetota bacterium]
MPMSVQQQPAWLVWSGGALAALALTWMAYAWVVAPNHERAREADEINTAAAAERATAQQLEDQLGLLTQAMAERRAALDAMPLKLGNRQQLNLQIASLIQLAQAQGLEVLQLQPGETQPGEHYDLTGLRLEAIAGFPEHLAFLDALHAAFPDVSVVGLNLTSNARNANPRPRASFNLVWFTSVDQAALSRIDPGDDR